MSETAKERLADRVAHAKFWTREYSSERTSFRGHVRDAVLL